MGSVESYEIAGGRRYLVRYRSPEKRQVKERGFTTKLAAKQRLAEIEVAKARGAFVDPASGKTTVGGLGSAWLEAQRGFLKPSSFRPLESAWRIHVAPRWGDVQLRDIRFSAVQLWITSLNDRLSPTMVKRCLGILSGILETAVRDRLIHANACVGIKTPHKVPKSRVYLNHQQVRALAAQCGDRSTLVLVMAYTGLRWGEAIALRVRDVNVERRRLQVDQNAVEVGDTIHVGTPKSHERRSVAFPETLTADIAAATGGKGPDDLLFPGRDGQHLRRTRSNAGSSGWFAGAVRRARLPHLTPHDLRHTAAALAVQSGANVLVVQRMLGHKSAAMTLDVYADLFDNDLDDVAARMNTAILQHAS